jgi:hypothetical protein
MVPKVKRFREWLVAEVETAVAQLEAGEEPSNAELASVDYRDQASL